MRIAARIAGEYSCEIIAIARCSSRQSMAGMTVVRFTTLDLEKNSVASLNIYVVRVVKEESDWLIDTLT